MKKDLYPFKLYVRLKPIKTLFGLSLLCNFGIILWLSWYVRPQEVPIFLHHNVLFGVDLTGPWYAVFYLPLIGIIILIVNLLLGMFLYKKDKLTSQVLALVTFFCHIFLVMSAVLLVFLNV
ncbi:MAG: hypothetical protein CL685_02390 [Candidatus Magasanikbacteria bacterium]|nr:hypothetical protein [Candidatus Magasanikbacteria bacterium]